MNILIAIIILGILILIHEAGHFIVAKICGVYVEKFSLGFGPRLFGRKIGETDYCVSAFPLGGYVKMYGQDPDEKGDPAKAGRAFSEKTAIQRAAIILAGPVANILLAVVIFWGLFMSGYKAYAPIVGEVTEGSPAQLAGIRAGDTIISVNGKKIQSWNEFLSIVIESPKKELNIALADGRSVGVIPNEVEVTDIFGDKDIAGDIGAQIDIPAVIGALVPGYPAAESGLKVNDKILAINGTEIGSWNSSSKYIRAHPEEALEFTILRNGVEEKLSITPKLAEGRGVIGINPTEGDVEVRFGVIESLGLGFQKSYEFTKIVLIGFEKLITRSVSTDSLGGPIMIVQMAADSASSGLAALLTFMAVISVNLAVFNLLPIPVLDGGHLLVIIIESVTRRKLSERVLGAFQMFGFALLMCLMVFAFYNDLSRIFQ